MSTSKWKKQFFRRSLPGTVNHLTEGYAGTRFVQVSGKTSALKVWVTPRARRRSFESLQIDTNGDGGPAVGHKVLFEGRDLGKVGAGEKAAETVPSSLMKITLSKGVGEKGCTCLYPSAAAGFLSIPSGIHSGVVTRSKRRPEVFFIDNEWHRL